MAALATAPQIVPTASPAAPAKAPTLGSLSQQLNTEVSEAKLAGDKLKTDLEGITSKFGTRMGELRAQMPKAPEVKPFEAPEKVDPLSAFGSSAGILAGIASLFTRTPLTTSLKALTAGMDAISKGNAHAYEQAFDEWKSNTDYAFKAFDAQNEAYDQMLDLAKTDYDAAIRGIQQIAAMTDDKVMMTVAQMGEITKMEQLSNERKRLSIQAQEAAWEVGIPAQILKDSVQEFQMIKGRPPNAAEMSGLYQQAKTGMIVGEDAGAASNIAKAVAKYQIPLPQGRSLQQYGGQNFINQVLAVNPSYNAGMFPAIRKAISDFNTGRQGNLVRSGNVAIQHLQQLHQAAVALKNGDVQKFNAVKQRLARETGQTMGTNFDAVAKVAGDEIVKFVQGGGAAAGALADREAIAENISKAMSTNQLEGVIDMYIGLLAGQVEGLRQQYEQSTFQDDFDRYLHPDTKAAINKHAAPHSSGGQSADFSKLWGGK
ncbi:MAG: hypothetical protein E6R03_07945 [Hyphomicrobiaceae bacterium]|nr:MAG: hypothetical protein E6R03_07945 [Hyphomicrobiaceae bacterium]